MSEPVVQEAAVHRQHLPGDEAGGGHAQERDGRGDLIAHIGIVIPTKLTERQRELLQELAESEDEEVNTKRTPWQRIKDALS